MVPTYSFPIFGKDTFLAKHILKSGVNRIPNLGSFPSPPNHVFCFSSTVGPASFALARSQDDRAPALLHLSLPLVWFFYPLHISCYFCFVLSYFSLLFSSSCVSCCHCFVSCKVCHFLWFDFSLLHTILVIDTFYYSLFLSIMFLLIRFNSYPLYKRIWAFVGQIIFIGLKGSWTQFALIC